MFVAVIVIAVYSILGVGFYAERAPVLFGDFGRATWTLVTAATMENWVTYAVDLMGGDPSNLDPGVVMYFVSYIVMVAYVLTSVIVAVLLENFSEANQNEHEIEIGLEESEGLKEAHKTGSFPLDALMAELIQVDTHDDLVMQLDMLFDVLDVDASGELSFYEMQLGLQALDVRPRIQITIDDFQAMTIGGRYSRVVMLHSRCFFVAPPAQASGWYLTSVIIMHLPTAPFYSFALTESKPCLQRQT